jgi:hypothetical protein
MDDNGITHDPEKITATVCAADLIMGRDAYAMRFVENFQDSM